MKYIDAEKLKKLISEKYCEFRLKGFKEDSIWYHYADGLDFAKQLIDSLQQEQPEVNLVARLKQHLATTPKEQLEKEWKELEPWNNIGPTVQEFLYGKQPEVDLEKEIKKERIKLLDAFGPMNGEQSLAIRNFARHFYELGLNARKGK